MNAGKTAVKWAGAGVFSLVLAATPAFAAGQWSRDGNRDGQSRDRQSTQAQTDQRANRTNDQRRNGQQQVNVAPVVAQPAYTSQRNDQNRYHSNNQSQNNVYQSRGRVDQSNSYRENQRVNVSGRVQSFSRERNGYRVHLDSGSYWIPESRFGNRARDLRVGVSLSLGGIFNGGVFGIDAVSWGANSGYGYDQGYVRGVVQHIDYRSGMMTLRDASSGRLFEVDMRDAGGARLGRGEYVTLSGRWIQGNVFAAYRVDSVG